MKTRFIIMLLTVIVLAACSKETKVKNEFKKWVKQEYADPTVIKEIVEVENFYTITSQEYKKKLEQIATRGKKSVDDISEVMEWAQENRYYYNKTFNNNIIKVGKIIENEFKNFNLLSKTIDKIGDQNMTEHNFRIKVRELENGEVVFNYYFVSEINGDFAFRKAGDEDSNLMLQKLYDGDILMVYSIAEVIQSEMELSLAVESLMEEKERVCNNR